MKALVKIVKIVLAGVTQFIGALSHTPKDGKSESPLGHIQEATNLPFYPVSLFLFLKSIFKKKIQNKCFYNSGNSPKACNNMSSIYVRNSPESSKNSKLCGILIYPVPIPTLPSSAVDFGQLLGHRSMH